MKDHGPIIIEAPERMQALMNDIWHKALELKVLYFGCLSKT